MPNTKWARSFGCLALLVITSAGARVTLSNFEAALPHDRPTPEQRLVTAVSNDHIGAMHCAWRDCREFDSATSLKSLDTALRVAVLGGEERAVALLIEWGADINRADSHGNTPLMLAPGSPNGAASARRLLRAGASAAAVDGDGQDALDLAIARGDRELVLVLNNLPN